MWETPSYTNGTKIEAVANHAAQQVDDIIAPRSGRKIGEVPQITIRVLVGHLTRV